MTKTMQQQFEVLIAQHQGILHKVARSYCYCAESQRDLMQDMLVQLWRSFEHYQATMTFSTWMYRVALNVAISSLRAQTAQKRDEEQNALQHDTQHTVSSQGDQLITLQRALAKFEPTERALLILQLEGLSHTEIADVLSLSVTNVSSTLSRLKQRLSDRATTE